VTLDAVYFHRNFLSKPGVGFIKKVGRGGVGGNYTGMQSVKKDV
jgi:hypothetical protein